MISDIFRISISKVPISSTVSWSASGNVCDNVRTPNLPATVESGNADLGRNLTVFSYLKDTFSANSSLCSSIE